MTMNLPAESGRDGAASFLRHARYPHALEYARALLEISQIVAERGSW